MPGIALQGTSAIAAPAPVAGPAIAVPIPGAPAALVPAIPAPAASGPDASSFSSLKAGVTAVSEARDEAGQQTALDQVYLGAGAPAESEDIVSISASPRFSAATPTLSPYRALAAAPDEAASGKSLAELEASAKDSSLPFAERVSAVAAIAGLASDEARASLKSIGLADPEASALGYEVKRKALQALAGLGEVVSLPPVSRRHADEILKSLTDEKPEAAIFDYDDTLERNQRQASPKTAAALKAVADAGVGTMILTARSDRTEDMTGKTVLESLSTLTPKQKAGLVIGSSRGARVLVFDKKGEARLVADQPAWTESEREAIDEAAAAVKARYGEAQAARVGELTDFAFSLYLPVGTSPQDVEGAARLFETELSRRGVKPAAISGRVARNQARPSFIVASKYDKSLGVGLYSADRDYFDRVRDIAQRLPTWAWKPASKAAALLPRKPVPGKNILMVGDRFFGSRVEDLNMTKAAPEGLALDVGGTADPRVERVFVWPSQDFTATQEIMAALAAKSGGGVDRKAIGGLFAQRTLSIIAFVLTSIAYPFIAIPVVGVAGYGALMALGPLAAIATGPLNGLIARKLSARNAMALNTVVRGVLAVAMPVLFLSMLMLGLFFGPANVALSSYFYKNVPKSQTEKYIGIQSSLFNAAISLGYCLFSLMAKPHAPAFPGMLLPIAVAFVAAGVVFYFAPRWLRGLPATSLAVTKASAPDQAGAPAQASSPSQADPPSQDRTRESVEYRFGGPSAAEILLRDLRWIYQLLTSWASWAPR